MSSIFDILIGLIFLPLIIMFLTSVINSAFGPFLKKSYCIKKYPKVSVLIPARNEETNIRTCLKSIACSNYPDFEIIVLDDNSTDGTLKVIKECRQEFPMIKFIEGKPLSKEWLGKPWACHQLSEQASGEILIFTDADNTYSKNAVSNTVGYMQRFELDFLSAFPEQRTNTFAEKLIIPMIDLIAYSFFILWSSYFVKLAIFIEANGQWLAVRKASYIALGGHQQVKDKIVEDTELGRLFKKKRMKTLTVAGTGMVFGRMYDSIGAIWQGLSKNLYGIAGYNAVLFFTLISMLAYNTLLPYSFFLTDDYYYILLLALSLNILWRMILSLSFHRSSFIISILFHPISIIMLIGIAINSYLQSVKGTIQWKGRNINPGIRYDKRKNK